MSATLYAEATWVLSDDAMVRASFVDRQEGYGGEYNPNDPDDAALYRLEVEVSEKLLPELGWNEDDYEPAGEPGWVFPNHGSTCTTVEIISTSTPVLMDLLAYAANQVADDIRHGGLRGAVEQLSYLPSRH